jgi:hypothetical protein
MLAITSNMILQGLIVVGSVLLFFIALSLNRNTKAPKGIEIPEKCQSCFSDTCVIKISDVDRIKEEMRAEIDKCDTGDINEEK